MKAENPLDSAELMAKDLSYNHIFSHGSLRIHVRRSSIEYGYEWSVAKGQNTVYRSRQIHVSTQSAIRAAKKAARHYERNKNET